MGRKNASISLRRERTRGESSSQIPLAPKKRNEARPPLREGGKITLLCRPSIPVKCNFEQSINVIPNCHGSPCFGPKRGELPVLSKNLTGSHSPHQASFVKS